MKKYMYGGEKNLNSTEDCEHEIAKDYIYYPVLSRLSSMVTSDWKMRKEKPILMSDVITEAIEEKSTAFGTVFLRCEIEEIEFVRMNPDIMPEGAWDASADKSKSVWVWAVRKNEGLSLRIGSKDGVYANQNCNTLFCGYSRLKRIQFHNLFDTCKVTDMFGMFKDCEKLENINMSNFDTGHVTDMSLMFYKCRKIKEIDVNNFVTENVENMAAMFCSCENLEKLNISRFDTGKVRNMISMFGNCENLRELDVSNFDTSCVTSMECMFAGDVLLSELDIKNFDIGMVKNMSGMFWDCVNLKKLDISNWHFKENIKIDDMFKNSGLENVYRI